MKDSSLALAIERMGSESKAAALLGISKQAVNQWQRAPVNRVLEIERHSGVPRHFLRPDIYPAEGTFGGS